MSRQICMSVWLISSVTLAILDLRSVALLQNDTSPHHCYNCVPSNSSVEGCSQQQATLTLCPKERPYCATEASTPNVTSSLVCSEATQQQCSLSYTAQKQSYKITCVCSGDRCNTPFSQDLRQELLKFAATGGVPKNETLDIIEVFLKESGFSNQTRSTLREKITLTLKEPTTTIKTTTVFDRTESKRIEAHPPRAEALNQGVVSPSDDDDDDGEGSGADEDSRSQVRGSPPAAPSSYLPADSGATTLLFNLLVTPVLLHVVV